MTDLPLGMAETVLGRIKALAGACGEGVAANLTKDGIVISRWEEERVVQRVLGWMEVEGLSDPIPPALLYLKHALSRTTKGGEAA